MCVRVRVCVHTGLHVLPSHLLQGKGFLLL